MGEYGRLVFELRRRLGSAVVERNDSRWDRATCVYHALAEPNPLVVVEVASPRDVSDVIAVASNYGIQVAPISTGHHAMAMGDLSNTILIRMGRLLGCEVDREKGIVSVAAGECWGSVVQRAQRHRLGVLAGTSPYVGVVGYALGGGIGWQARAFGFACNTVHGVELVTAAGEIVRVDCDEPELFWALRGGGGSLGVVTSIEFEAHQEAPLYGGSFIFPMGRAGTVAKSWRDWSIEAPDAVTTNYRIIQSPNIGELADLRRRQRLVCVDAVATGGAVDDSVFDPIRQLNPIAETMRPLRATELGSIHRDPRGPVTARATHSMLMELTDDVIESIVSVAETCPPTLDFFELRRLGGALARSDPSHGILDCVSEPFAAFALAADYRSDVDDQALVLMSDFDSAMSAVASERRLMNFVEGPASPESFFKQDDLKTLRAAIGRLNPANLVRASHEVPAKIAESPIT